MRMMDLFAEEKDYGNIYFVQMENTGPIKSGFSKNIINRMSDLKVASPYPLKMVHSYRGTRKDEQLLHSIFRKDSLRGEWFLPSKRVIKFIKESVETEKDRIYRDPTTHERQLMTKTQWLSLVRWRKNERVNCADNL